MSARSERDGTTGPRGSRMMRKAEALGMETRNVSNSYLLPVLSRGGGAGTLYGGASHTAIAGAGSYHETINLSPKAITALRTTKMLQSLGQKVIFSNDPYVNSAFESLITTRVSGVPPDLAPDLAELISRKPPGGRLRPKGSKAAALKRAKRLVGAGAVPVASEVPFVDALRVCDLERDKSALPALLRAYVFNKARVVVPKLEEYCEAMGRLRPSPMLQAAALLMQAGYFFAAIKVVYSNFDALQATLTELEVLISQHMDSGDWDTAAALWNWKDPDRELFLKQFKELKIISYYLDVRKQLRALKEQGVVALARVEREMLLKVVQDFRMQLAEDYAAYQAQLAKEAEERAKAKARLEAQARAAAEAAARRAEEAARVEARARAAAEVKARREAEMREKARDMERKREEVRRRAEQAKLRDNSASMRNNRPVEYALMAGEAASMFEEGAPHGDDGPLVDPEPEQEPEASDLNLTEVSEAVLAPGAEKSETIAAAEAADRISELRTSSSAGSRRGSASSRQGSSSGSRKLSSARLTATSESGLPEDHDPAAAASPSTNRPPVRVHLRPNSRGLRMQLSMDGRRPASSQQPAAVEQPPPPLLGRLPVRVHLRPTSRGVRMQLSMDGTEQEELRRGIEELRRSMSQERQRASEAAEQMKHMAVKGSRPSTATPAIRLNINLTAGTTDEKLAEMEKALEAERAEFQRRLEEERAALAAVLAAEKSKLEDHLSEQKKLFDEERQRLLRDLYEQQGRDIDQQLLASNQSIEQLRQQRDKLRSAGGSRHSSGRNAAAAEEASRLEAAVKMLEKKLDDELSHVRQLEDEKTRVEKERQALEQAQRTLEAQKSQAELEKAKAEQEKGALQEQIAKTMRMFQEQLAQTVKMAAMLQAQRILGAATGGAAPMGALGGTLMAQSSNGSIGLNTGGLVAQQSSMGLGTMGMNLPGTAGSLTSAPGMNLTGTLSASPSMGAAAAAATASMLPQPVAALPGDVDDPPTQDEIVAYGKYLGMDVVEDADLLYIAEWALTAPLPEGWTVHLDGEGNEFFYNAATNASTYEHPMDEHYRAYYRKMKEQKQLARMTEAQQ
ncbi:hypothetical protein Vretimale_18473 [Volvox reticuliferus]|uniref:Uncharacterized protein n=1 Tax=Volvox reticuliferus TaxID=1737510 RepID=A0A8J4D277_9CHLO|nr:hypothetical protein Vretifemale_19787 [Volvox reticuliferus]GIM15763.1 hypothetical protein Vretimale_18473 [Volvox reticuliferus]